MPIARSSGRSRMAEGTAFSFGAARKRRSGTARAPSRTSGSRAPQASRPSRHSRSRGIHLGPPGGLLRPPDFSALPAPDELDRRLGESRSRVGGHQTGWSERAFIPAVPERLLVREISEHAVRITDHPGPHGPGGLLDPETMLRERFRRLGDEREAVEPEHLDLALLVAFLHV